MQSLYCNIGVHSHTATSSTLLKTVISNHLQAPPLLLSHLSHQKGIYVYFTQCQCLNTSDRFIFLQAMLPSRACWCPIAMQFFLHPLIKRDSHELQSDVNMSGRILCIGCEMDLIPQSLYVLHSLGNWLWIPAVQCENFFG